MNIFFLYKNARKAARAQCDKHVVKMGMEATQMLCTAIRCQRGESAKEECDTAGLYRATHVNHPTNVWVRASVANFLWTLDHAKALFQEYTARYGRIHKSSLQIPVIEKFFYTTPFPFRQLMVPPQCMTDYCRNTGTEWNDVIRAYRLYYKTEKMSFAKWNYSRKPTEIFSFE